MSPEKITVALWILWFVSWVAASFWSSRDAKKGSVRDEVFFRLVLSAGVIFLFAAPANREFAPAGLWHPSNPVKWMMVAVAFAGFAFTWWARVHLGRLWSAGRVTTKTGHRVVDTGPYRLVRHPIYSGLILAAFATAIEKGNSLALVGAALIAAAFYRKARAEERFLRAQLGEEAYDAYARKTAMLVPPLGKN
jgi:protein-S-isoprenylcysteine O-methyltransferase Ste14